MPIEGITQPELLVVDDTLRLRRYEGICDFALPWYQDAETVWLVDGNRTPYTLERLKRMYEYLNRRGEVYFIEAYENGCFRPVGDAAFWREDMPVVIGEKAYRNKGIGTKVVAALTERGRSLGYDALFVREIYEYNTASRKCFEKVGFRACEKTERGNRFRLALTDGDAGV